MKYKLKKRKLFRNHEKKNSDVIIVKTSDQARHCIQDLVCGLDIAVYNHFSTFRTPS